MLVRRLRSAVICLAVAGIGLSLGLVPLEAQAHPATHATGAAAEATRSDFDGDGLDDFISARLAECPVTITYSSGVPFACPSKDGYSSSLMLGSADFNGDGFDDLALGLPDDTFKGGGTYAGAVDVYYGSSSGLLTRAMHITQNTPHVGGVAGRFHNFGSALAAGDINGDGADDLVIGVPGDDVLGRRMAGSLLVVPGSPDGLVLSHSLRFGQARPDVPGRDTAYAKFGGALTVADITGDGFADVVTSSYGDSDYLVVMLRGSAAGVTTLGASFVQTARISGASQIETLASGDVNGDGYADVVGGASDDQPGGGILDILGVPRGLSPNRVPVLTQDSPGVPGTASTGNFWGSALAVGDLNGDGFDDALVGAPFESVASQDNAGTVTLLHGSSVGLRGYRARAFSEASPGFCEDPRYEDWFGYSVSIGHYAPIAHDDALIGAPGADSGSGTVQGLHGGGRAGPRGCVMGGSGDRLGMQLLGSNEPY